MTDYEMLVKVLLREVRAAGYFVYGSGPYGFYVSRSRTIYRHFVIRIYQHEIQVYPDALECTIIPFDESDAPISDTIAALDAASSRMMPAL